MENSQEKSRLQKQFEFALELDKEKFIGRQTYLTGAVRKENDAEHAWHMAVMAILLSEYANEEIDILKTVTMILMHDVVEIDAGDTYAYDEEGKKSQAEREKAAAERLYGILPKDQAEKYLALWREFEDRSTPEARFARAMDNIQPLMLNNATNGRSWLERGIDVSQVFKRNQSTAEGAKQLWEYSRDNFILPNVEKGRLTDKEGIIDKTTNICS